MGKHLRERRTHGENMQREEQTGWEKEKEAGLL